MSNPSHASARILEFLPESDMGILEESDGVIFEGSQLGLLEEENIFIRRQENPLTAFADRVISENFMKVVSKQIKFSL